MCVQYGSSRGEVVFSFPYHCGVHWLEVSSKKQINKRKADMVLNTGDGHRKWKLAREYEERDSET